jgi:hypothetical protein
VGFLALASLRREQRASQPAPEPEDVQAEMEPRKAARHYASQMPSLRLRALVAGAVCLLLTWITLSCGFRLAPARRPDIICAPPRCEPGGELTVLLLGLQHRHLSFMSLLLGRRSRVRLIDLAALPGAGHRGVALPTMPTRLPLRESPPRRGFGCGGLVGRRAYHDTF